jgi:Pet100
MKSLNFEVFKFGIYILFPIGSLYYFNNPTLMDSYHSSLDNIYAIQKRMEKSLFTNLPRSQDEIQGATDEMKKRYAEMKIKEGR